MNGKCYNCKYIGEFEWYWLITDSNDDSIAHGTSCMTYDESIMGDTHTVVYYCPNCNSEQ